MPRAPDLRESKRVGVPVAGLTLLLASVPATAFAQGNLNGLLSILGLLLYVPLCGGLGLGAVLLGLFADPETRRVQPSRWMFVALSVVCVPAAAFGPLVLADAIGWLRQHDTSGPAWYVIGFYFAFLTLYGFHAYVFLTRRPGLDGS